MIPKLHTLGRVAGTHGFHGQISIHYLEGSPQVPVSSGSFVFIEFDGKGVPFLIEKTDSAGRVLKLADINTLEEAAELEGRTCYTDIVQHDDDSLHALRGYSVFHAGAFAGVVENVVDLPAGPALEVTINQSLVLIPLVEEWILKVDKKSRKIFMELPDGLMDING